MITAVSSIESKGIISLMPLRADVECTPLSTGHPPAQAKAEKEEVARKAAATAVHIVGTERTCLPEISSAG